MALDLDEPKRLVADLGDKSVMILRNHGLLDRGRQRRLRYHLALQLLLVLVYMVIAERVVEIVWVLRAH